MITAEIKMGDDWTTNVHGKTIEEVIEKIKSFHTMGEFEHAHYTKKGKLDSILASGWYLQETETVL